MVKHQDATPSPRIAKLAEQIRTIVAEMLGRRIKDPRLGFVTITDVRLTGDAREATIFYTVMGSTTDRSATAAALRSANGVLRSAVGKRLGLRHAPSLEFVLDATPESAAAIEDLLAAARHRDEELAASSSRAQFAGEADPYRRPEDLDDDQDAADEAGFAADQRPAGPAEGDEHDTDR